MSQLNFEGKDKETMAIERLRQYEPVDGYYLAFSGGKDSVVLYDLAVKSGVKFEAHYSLTTVDPPELVKFIRDYYPTVIWDRPAKTMWQLIETNGLPYQAKRWCCRLLKESNGAGAILTGVRHEESENRSKRCVFENDHSSNERWFVNPIIDWLTTEVWAYIKTGKLPYCQLYDEGWERIGCLLCPLAKPAEKVIIVNKYPQIAKAYYNAFSRYQSKKDASINPRLVFNRWLLKTPKPNKNQMGLFV